jgi:hypothetical protein
VWVTAVDPLTSPAAAAGNPFERGIRAGHARHAATRRRRRRPHRQAPRRSVPGRRRHRPGRVGRLHRPRPPSRARRPPCRPSSTTTPRRTIAVRRPGAASRGGSDIETLVEVPPTEQASSLPCDLPSALRAGSGPRGLSSECLGRVILAMAFAGAIVDLSERSFSPWHERAGSGDNARHALHEPPRHPRLVASRAPSPSTVSRFRTSPASKHSRVKRTSASSSSTSRTSIGLMASADMCGSPVARAKGTAQPQKIAPRTSSPGSLRGVRRVRRATVPRRVTAGA